MGFSAPDEDRGLSVTVARLSRSLLLVHFLAGAVDLCSGPAISRAKLLAPSDLRANRIIKEVRAYLSGKHSVV